MKSCHEWPRLQQSRGSRRRRILKGRIACLRGQRAHLLLDQNLLPPELAQHTQVFRRPGFVSRHGAAQLLRKFDQLGLQPYTNNPADFDPKGNAVHVTHYLQTRGVFGRQFPHLRARILRLAALERARNVVLTAATKSGLTSKSAPEDLHNDHTVVLAAVTESDLALKFTSVDSKNDIDVELAAVAKGGVALKSTSEDLNNTRDVALAADTTGFLVSKFPPEDLRNARDVALAAVTKGGLASQLAPEDLKNYRDVVMAAVTKSFLA